jgi:hypothetical protein
MSSMLAALGGPPGMDASGGPPPGPLGPPPGMGGPPPGLGGGAPPVRDPSEILKGIVKDLQEYIATDESDAQETAQATKALVLVQGLLASEEKNMEAASGTTPAHKAMARQINSLAGQAYGG